MAQRHDESGESGEDHQNPRCDRVKLSGYTTVPSERVPYSIYDETRPGFADMPTEILQLIFERSVAPSFLISPVYAIREDAWLGAMHTKQSLSRVCRLWYPTAIALLYCDVGLRSAGQIAALLDTLQNTPSLIPLVRSITIVYDFIANQQDAYVDDVTQILRLCKQVYKVSFMAKEWYWPDPGQLAPLAGSTTAFLPHITCLHFDSCQERKTLYSASPNTPEPPILRNFSSQLAELQLYIHEAYIPEITFTSLVTFTCLSSIKIHVPAGTMALRRSLHSLRAMARTCVTCTCMSTGPSVVMTLGSPCNRHSITARDSSISSFRSALDVHPAVQWIDVWNLDEIDKKQEPGVVWTDARKVREGLRNPGGLESFTFPCLRGVRTIDSSLLTLRDLPRIMRPEVWTGVDASFEYPGLTVNHIAGRIWRVNVDPIYDDGFRPGSSEEEEDDECDEDIGWRDDDMLFKRRSYSPPQDEDGSSVHSSDSSWVASDKEVDAEDQLTHADILHLFRLEGQRRQQVDERK
ncbi:hypothetical protein BD626DRAFT_608134 [Schizophyllum amplum]|uniref:F-box domain-containing protein n=1 Tax=Schizophyllum amplum TaxID=97359 RepID=A0A550C3T1_9AGAR|nr:hypothetical protein BD626DRAFT_608134 [Auriculariopsis ampla]